MSQQLLFFNRLGQRKSCSKLRSSSSLPSSSSCLHSYRSQNAKTSHHQPHLNSQDRIWAKAFYFNSRPTRINFSLIWANKNDPSQTTSESRFFKNSPQTGIRHSTFLFSIFHSTHLPSFLDSHCRTTQSHSCSHSLNLPNKNIEP